jgi:predicted enzyme related to lactoylglutathione lyase
MQLQKNLVTWFEIYVDDMHRAKTFYETVFGCQLIAEKVDDTIEAFRFPGGMPGIGAMGALMKHPLRKPSKEGTIIYFHCEDCESTSQKAKDNGGEIFRIKTSIGQDGFIAIIGDSEGNVIGLHSFQ